MYDLMQIIRKLYLTPLQKVHKSMVDIIMYIYYSLTAVKIFPSETLWEQNSQVIKISD